MRTQSAPWAPPADFTSYAIVETLPQLATRYGVHSSTCAKAIIRLPASVQEARMEMVHKRRSDAGRKGALSSARASIRQRRNKVGVSLYRDPVDVSDRAIRAATVAFETHYCDVADRHPEWDILGYAA